MFLYYQRTHLNEHMEFIMFSRKPFPKPTQIGNVTLADVAVCMLPMHYLRFGYVDRDT